MVIFQIAWLFRAIIVAVVALSISAGYALGIDQTFIKWWYDRKRNS